MVGVTLTVFDKYGSLYFTLMCYRSLWSFHIFNCRRNEVRNNGKIDVSENYKERDFYNYFYWLLISPMSMLQYMLPFCFFCISFALSELILILNFIVATEKDPYGRWQGCKLEASRAKWKAFLKSFKIDISLYNLPTGKTLMVEETKKFFVKLIFSVTILRLNLMFKLLNIPIKIIN